MPALPTNYRYTHLGELLWSLQFSVDGELDRIGWQALERLLRRYVSVLDKRVQR